MLKTQYICMLPMEVQKFIYSEMVKAVGKVHARRAMYSRLCDLEEVIDVDAVIKETTRNRKK